MSEPFYRGKSFVCFHAMTVRHLMLHLVTRSLLHCVMLNLLINMTSFQPLRVVVDNPPTTSRSRSVQLVALRLSCRIFMVIVFCN